MRRRTHLLRAVAAVITLLVYVVSAAAHLAAEVTSLQPEIALTAPTTDACEPSCQGMSPDRHCHECSIFWILIPEQLTFVPISENCSSWPLSDDVHSGLAGRVDPHPPRVAA